MITGGASGIGRAFGENLARRGFIVVLADRQLDVAEGVAAAIRERGGTALAAELDVRDRAAFKALAERIQREHGSIDYLFNNAGIGVGATIDEHEPEDWDDVLDVNIRGVVHGVEAVYPIMVAQGAGHIINTASTAGFLPMAGEASYTTSKHAVVGLSKSLRVEGRAHGVKCTALCPGAVRTPIFHGGKFGRLRFNVAREKLDELWNMMRPMDVDVFADKALAGIFKGRFIVIEPFYWRLTWLFERLAPNLSLRFWGRMFQRFHREIREAEVSTETQTSAGDDPLSATSGSAP